MSNVELSPNKSQTNKFNWFWLVLLVLPLIVTAKIQFSCYPMITNGELRKACYIEPTLSQVIQDPHTHGITLYKLASDLGSDEGLLRDLISKLDIARVDYDPINLQIALIGNKKTPSDILETIIDNLISQKKLSEPVQVKIVENPNTPDRVLETLIKLNNERVIYLISQRPKLSRQIIALLGKTINPQSTYYRYILAGIASQENTPKEILEKLAQLDICEINLGLDKNPTLEEKLGRRKVEEIKNKAQKCLISCVLNPDQCKICQPKHLQNGVWGVLGGVGVMGLVLTIGSGGLLAPLAIGAGALAGVATTALAEFVTKCPLIGLLIM